MEWVKKRRVWGGGGKGGGGVRCLASLPVRQIVSECLLLGAVCCHQIAFDKSVTSLGSEGQDTMAIRATTAPVAVGRLMGVRVKDKMIGEKKGKFSRLRRFASCETIGKDRKVNVHLRGKYLNTN